MPSTGTIKVSDKQREARIKRAVAAIRAGTQRKQLRARFTHAELGEAARRVREEKPNSKLSLRWRHVDRPHARDLREDLETEE